MIIRTAMPGDAESLLAIYAPYVGRSAVTFEYDVPSAEEFRDRIERTLGFFPYLVAEEANRPLGYAYAGRFQPREAYDWTVETSIYLDGSARRRGIGTQLHAALERACRTMNVQSMCACIAAPRTVDDPFLTDASIRFHAHLGYRMVGRFEQVGYKFNRWYDMVWMERLIGDHAIPAVPVMPYGG